ncbi:hypothetical protein OsI_21895 [Oryza sativa Indica Group]|uniref:Uncharacterized protein n=1 Tax=Oryza sativa subsp. indica TaxID=39946 RepID=A2Y9Y9_ORYSI|nr:hypothetical protein OsI_21895 [Oryza sativa Indica Group]
MAGSDHHPGGRDGAPLVFDELRWVIQIRRSLQEDGGDDDDDNGIPVSVFNVPKQLQAHKPEAYVPQFIALGPYHHWRPELYEMERYKLAAARRAQRHLREGVKLEHLVEQFARAERKVRAHYHRYLDFSGETLAWMMVVDGAFLLEFLQIFAAAEAAASGGGGKPELRRVSSRMAHLEKQQSAGCEYVKQLLAAVWGIVSSLKSGPMQYVAKPISFAVKAPWKMLTVVPGFSAMKHPVESFFMSGGGGDPSSSSTAAGQDHHHAISRPPLIEEIMIPSVTELAAAGVQFAPTNGDATTVSFDAKTATLHLPVVTLDGSTTEVVLRNLVAYEASAATGPLVLARYTELMNGIIDTGEDVAALRRRGVVLNRMKSDGEAARLWNGMSRSVRLTKVAAMDAAVEGVNRYHGARWRVKARRFMRRYVFGSWQLLTFLAAVLMLLLTTLQAFCSVYTCSRWFGAVAVAPPP